MCGPSALLCPVRVFQGSSGRLHECDSLHPPPQAFAADPYMDLFEIPAAQRAAVFAAMARIVISRSRHQHCLYVAQGGSAVAVVTRSDVQVGAGGVAACGYVGYGVQGMHLAHACS